MAKSKEKSGKFINFIMVIVLIIALVTSAFAIYEIFLLNSIEDLMRYIVMGVIAFLDLVFILKTRRYVKGKKKRKKPRK